MSINRSALRAFHAVASEGGFSRAARALGLTQPTLSGQVKALEETYGVRLFDRRGRRVRLTELGSGLLDLTRRLYTLEGEAEQLLAAERGLKRGHLRLGADAPYGVMKLMAAFGRRYSGIRVTVATGNSEALLQALFDHRLDVAVVANVAPDPRLHALALRRDRLVAFVGQDHPWRRRRQVTLVELAAQRLILRERGSTTRRIFETALARAGIPLNDSIEIASREAVREAVAAGLGVGIVAEAEFGNDPRLKAIAIADTRLDSVEYLVCLADRRELRLVHAFFDLAGHEPTTRLTAG